MQVFLFWEEKGKSEHYIYVLLVGFESNVIKDINVSSKMQI
jgi:hypothetical protein